MKYFLLMAVVLSGCASVSGVIPEGQDRYMIASKAASFSTSGLAKANALQTANEYCAKAGKQMEMIQATEAKATFGNPAQASVEFKCVSTADARMPAQAAK